MENNLNNNDNKKDITVKKIVFIILCIVLVVIGFIGGWYFASLTDGDNKTDTNKNTVDKQTEKENKTEENKVEDKTNKEDNAIEEEKEEDTSDNKESTFETDENISGDWVSYLKSLSLAITINKSIFVENEGYHNEIVSLSQEESKEFVQSLGTCVTKRYTNACGLGGKSDNLITVKYYNDKYELNELSFTESYIILDDSKDVTLNSLIASSYKGELMSLCESGSNILVFDSECVEDIIDKLN